MTTTETQLREMLATYADQSGDNPARRVQVHRGVRRRRRSRAAAAGSLMLVLVAAVSIPIVARHGGSAQRLRTVTPQPVGRPYPDFADGGRLLGGGQLTTGRDQGDLTYVFTPTSYRFQVDVACTGLPVGSDTGNFTTDVVVNGHRVDELGGGCSDASSGYLSDAGFSERKWGGFVHLGQPTYVTVTPVSGQGREAVPADLHLTAATYQAVPFDAYPLPPRPATLTPIVPDSAGRTVLDARRVGASGSHSFTVDAGTADNETSLELYTDGPGLLDVAVDGHHVQTVGSYTWYDNDGPVSLSPGDLAAEGVEVRQGEPLTVTVTASHFTGPQWLAFYTSYG